MGSDNKRVPFPVELSKKDLSVPVSSFPKVSTGPSGHLYFMVVEHAVSPSDFCISSVSFQSFGKYVDWRDAFDKMYAFDASNQNMRVSANMTNINQLYACFNVDRQRWDRVRLVNVKEDTAKVFFYETLQSATVPISSLRQLSPQFLEMPLTTFRAELLDIEPSDGETWSKEACEFFKGYVDGKKFHTLIIKRGEEVIVDGVNMGFRKLQILMKDAAGKSYDEHLQAILVQNRFARATGCFGSFPKILERGEEKYPLSYYNELSLTRSPTLRDKEKEWLFVKLEAQVESQLPRGFRTKKGKKEKTRRMREATSELRRQLASGNWGQAIPSYQIPRTNIPTMIAQVLGRVKISYVKDPAWMYLQVVNRLPLLEKMEDAIGHYVENGVAATEGIKEGSPIACPFQKRPRIYENPIWARGVVMNRLNGDFVKVLMVDYGAEMTVQLENTRPLPLSFQEVPSFAHRVFLNSSAPPSLTSWDFSSVLRFKGRQDELRGAPLFVITNRNEDTFHLKSFTQRILYDNGKWSPEEIQEGDEPLHCLDKIRNNYLLSHFFVTFGVKLVYEKNGRHDPLFEFPALDGLY